MTLVDELKQKYPVQSIVPYGECLVVPGKLFDPDWESMLGEQRYPCIFTDIDGAPVVLVRLKGKGGSGEVKPVLVPEKSVVRPMLDPKKSWSSWTADEDEKLIQLWNERPKLTGDAIAEKMAPRTRGAIKHELARLIWKGKIKSRFKHRDKQAPKPAQPSPEAHTQTEASDPASAKLRPEAPSAEDALGILKEIRGLLTPREVSVYFECYCTTCRKGSSVEDVNVWKVCPVCGTSLTVWNVQES